MLRGILRLLTTNIDLFGMEKLIANEQETCRKDMTVGALKSQLEAMVDATPEEQDGKLLGDDKTLQESGVQLGAVLHLRLPVQGGRSAPLFKFADVTNGKAMERVAFALTAPRYT